MEQNNQKKGVEFLRRGGKGREALQRKRNEEKRTALITIKIL